MAFQAAGDGGRGGAGDHRGGLAGPEQKFEAARGDAVGGGGEFDIGFLGELGGGGAGVGEGRGAGAEQEGGVGGDEVFGGVAGLRLGGDVVLDQGERFAGDAAGFVDVVGGELDAAGTFIADQGVRAGKGQHDAGGEAGLRGAAGDDGWPAARAVMGAVTPAARRRRRERAMRAEIA